MLVLCLNLCACSNAKTGTQTKESESVISTENASAETVSVWDTAMYTEDTTLGSGDTTFTFKVEYENNDVTFTIKTDKETVSEALTEFDLISRDDSKFGLYVKNVNGIRADYDKDKAYWAFYVDGSYAETGVDQTEIKEGKKYSFVYTAE